MKIILGIVCIHIDEILVWNWHAEVEMQSESHTQTLALLVDHLDSKESIEGKRQLKEVKKDRNKEQANIS